MSNSNNLLLSDSSVIQSLCREDDSRICIDERLCDSALTDLLDGLYAQLSEAADSRAVTNEESDSKVTHPGLLAEMILTKSPVLNDWDRNWQKSSN